MAKAIPSSTWQEVQDQMERAGAAKKCWPCGCLHNSITSIEKAFSNGRLPKNLARTLHAVRDRLQPVRYDCLGCAVCFPALALNALNEEGADIQDNCPADSVEPRGGWPPLQGTYRALRYQAPVAVCTLGSEGLAESIAVSAEISGSDIAIVGSCQTENLGIERIIINVLANPNIRFLLICGQDSRQAVGHLPGQSLQALARSGIDKENRIVGAQGKRPILRNLERETVEHFRRTIEVIEMVGRVDAREIAIAARECGARNPGPAMPCPKIQAIRPQRGSIPEKMVSDPNGYFVVYVDRPRRMLVLEHYRNDGVLDAILEGGHAAELYMPVIDKELLSRLDHAAYLGRELARAERSLAFGEEYIQDAAPERFSVETSPVGDCGCGTTCKEQPK